MCFFLCMQILNMGSPEFILGKAIQPPNMQNVKAAIDLLTDAGTHLFILLLNNSKKFNENNNLFF